MQKKTCEIITLWHLLAQENTISAQIHKTKDTFEVVILFDGN